MKKIARAAALLALSIVSINAKAFDLKDLVGKVTEKAGSSSSSAVTDIIGNLISSDKITVNDLVGQYSYSKPAVAFKSDNLLKKAGGTAISSTVESKLAPYYKTAGLDKMTFIVNADSTFSMKVRGITFSGEIQQSTDKNSQANFVLKFKAIKKISLGSLNTYVVKGADKHLQLTFDITKLVTLLQKVGGITGSSSLKTVTSLLQSYDGICAGFNLAPVK